jgi:DNA-binding response OmpR family regulator
MARIMIVEDDAKLQELIAGHLRRYGHETVVAADFANVRDEFARLHPDLVLLDVNLPYYDGFYWCRQIRAVSMVPIIYLSARTSEMDQVYAMENGGDDYVTKPFSLEVLTAKVNSVLRRVQGEYAAAPMLRSAGGLTLDEQRSEVICHERRAELTPTEFRLLSLLMQNTGNIVARETLLEQLWDDMSFVDDNTLTVNVSRVRRKLAEVGYAGSIATRRGQGYLLEVSE